MGRGEHPLNVLVSVVAPVANAMWKNGAKFSARPAEHGILMARRNQEPIRCCFRVEACSASNLILEGVGE